MSEGKISVESAQAEKRRKCLYFLVPVILFVLTYAAFYVQANRPGGSDTTVHMAEAMSLDRVLGTSHCGWHFVCWLFYACLPITIEEAAAAATASFNALFASLVLWFVLSVLGKQEKGKNRDILVFFTVLASLLVGPLYLRFYNRRYYLGQGSPNLWHNPTSIAVRPFMLLITVLTVWYWEKEGERYIEREGRRINRTAAYEVLLGVLLLISTIVKPSYLMVYLPACGVRALAKLWKSRGRGFWRLVRQHLYFIPALVMLLYEYLVLYFFQSPAEGQEVSHVVIAFFRVARMHAPSVLVSLFLRMAFPFLVIFFWRKVIFKERYFPLIFGQYLAGLAITWTFAETGPRASHGNFGWGNIIACSMLWIFCLVFFLKQFLEERDGILQDRKRKRRYGLLFLLLAWHLAGGICFYLIQI